MKFNFKNVFLSLGITVFALTLFGFVSVGQVHAANTCTASTGNWSAAGTWSGCGGTIPQAVDTAIIPTGVTVTVDISGAVAAAVTLQDPVNSANALTIANNSTLLVSGALTIAGSSGTGNSTVTVNNNGTLLSVGSFSIVGGSSSGNSVLTTGLGAIATGGGITFSGTAARAQLTTTGAATLNLTGTISSGGTLNINSATGLFSTGASTINGAYTFGQATVSSGTLNIAAASTFASDVTINSGAIWSESAVPISFGGNLTNNGTFTAASGVHTFTGSSKTIGGSAITTIPSVSITGNTAVSGTLVVPTLLTIASSIILTNNGTITASSSLAGAGIFTNATNATLNIGNASSVAVFNATATGNTVNYTEAGPQTILAVPYYNLTLSGSGTKTVSNLATTAGTYTIVMGGHNYTATGGTPTTSITIGGSTVAVALPSGTFIFTSPNGYVLPSVDGNGIEAIQACNYPSAGSNSVTITGTGSTFTITPNPAVACLVGSGGGGQISNNSSNSTTTTSIFSTGPATITTSASPVSITSTPPIPVTINLPSASVSGCSSTVGFSVTTGQSCSGVVTVTNNPIPTTTYNFGTSTLKLGSKGNAVSQLQMFLNTNLKLSLVVDGKLGANTDAIIKQWQKAHGLKVDGLVGTKTKVLMNSSVQ